MMEGENRPGKVGKSRICNTRDNVVNNVAKMGLESRFYCPSFLFFREPYINGVSERGMGPYINGVSERGMGPYINGVFERGMGPYINGVSERGMGQSKNETTERACCLNTTARLWLSGLGIVRLGSSCRSRPPPPPPHSSWDNWPTCCRVLSYNERRWMC